MNSNRNMLLCIMPELLARTSGDWLAVTPAYSSLQFGVAGQSKEEAIEKFGRSLKEWVDTLYNSEDDYEKES